MLKKQVEKLLNEQTQKEAYSSYLYLAMASWAETQGMSGVAEWLYAQAEEEKDHMLKFIHFINERGSHAIIPAIEQPPKQWKDIYTMFNEVLEHEKFISESINKILESAIKEKDYAVQNWIQWFVEEQVEEESSVQTIIDKLNLLDKGKSGLYVFDKDIATMRSKK
ncbi:MAG TPA: ferritin [Bacteroidales bacterium]|jgi:ferritin|nr:ferritin [Bacteroidales bacterium]HXK81725.1 ferritin [Bacteroidales bacterium]